MPMIQKKKKKKNANEITKEKHPMTCCKKTLRNNNFGYVYDFSIIHTCPNSQTQRVFESIPNLDEICKKSAKCLICGMQTA